MPEYVHWHGFEIPQELDGTEEEGSLAVPASGRLQYEITPLQAGSRYVHSHAMTMNDLSRGVYSGQFVFVYVEPKRNPGRYDQEIFLSTHEWEPRLMTESDDESAEEDGDETEPRSMEIGYGVRSINGKALGHGKPLQVKQGQRVLFHVLNASATENVQLHLPGHRFHVVALDGNPVPRPGHVSVLELGVGERVDAFVEMNNPGVWIFGSVADDVDPVTLAGDRRTLLRRDPPPARGPGRRELRPPARSRHRHCLSLRRLLVRSAAWLIRAEQAPRLRLALLPAVDRPGLLHGRPIGLLLRGLTDPLHQLGFRDHLGRGRRQGYHGREDEPNAG